MSEPTPIRPPRKWRKRWIIFLVGIIAAMGAWELPAVIDEGAADTLTEFVRYYRDTTGLAGDIFGGGLFIFLGWLFWHFRPWHKGFRKEKM